LGAENLRKKFIELCPVRLPLRQKVTVPTSWFSFCFWFGNTDNYQMNGVCDYTYLNVINAVFFTKGVGVISSSSSALTEMPKKHNKLHQ
jgi:hypothetical protein